MPLNLMLLTSDPTFAAIAEEVGVDRIFFDLEYINKRERQRGRNTVISNNSIDGIVKVKKVLNKSELLVRVNPINLHSKEEINRVISDGADIVMLPMIIDKKDVIEFIEMVNGRAKTCLLIETPQAFVRIDEILEVDGVDEIFIGLNDLHIGMGLDFMFELLSGGVIEYLTIKSKFYNKPFGFGGIAKIGEGMLPAEVILGEHYRLGSSSVILSRTFKNQIESNLNEMVVKDLKIEIEKIRDKEKEIAQWSKEDYENNRQLLVKKVREIVGNLAINNIKK